VLAVNAGGVDHNVGRGPFALPPVQPAPRRSRLCSGTEQNPELGIGPVFSGKLALEQGATSDRQHFSPLMDAIGDRSDCASGKKYRSASSRPVRKASWRGRSPRVVLRVKRRQA